jgi:TonB-linked SusC/RagA family outer membrane protein
MGFKQVRRRSAVLGAMLLLGLNSVSAHAQSQNSVTGKVIDAQGNPVPGANVGAPELGIGVIASTRVDGTYTLQLPGNSAGKTVTIVARRIGFTPLNRKIAITSGTQTQDFKLVQDVANLDDVVVTGVAEATSSKNLTISVGKVGEAQLKDVPAVSPATALAGKVAGVRVSFTQGQPGSSPAIRIRTSTKLGVGAGGFVSKAQGPLVIIDGVISKNGLEDLDGNDIESIEVLKGAASANTFGSDAAGGVVAVTTKRGKNAPEGKVSFLTRNEFGTQGIEHYVPVLQVHPYALNDDGSIKENAAGQRILDADHYIDNAYPAGTYRNQLKENLQDGRTVLNYGQLSMRKGTTNFSTSFSRDTDRGIVTQLRGFRRQNLRFNIDQGLGDKADMSAAMTYGLSFSDQTPAVRSGSGSTFFSLLQAPPDVDLTYPNATAACDRSNPTTEACGTKYSPVLPSGPTNGTGRGNPLYDAANRSFNDRRERILGSFSARYRPWKWLTVDGAYGTDRLNQRSQNFYDRGLLADNPSVETASQGSIAINSVNLVSTNSQLNTTGTFSLGKLHSTTRLTYLYEEERNVALGVGFSKLNVASVPDIQAGDPAQLTGTGDGTGNGSANQQIRTLDGFVTQSLNYGDRYLVQLLGRRDGSSLFGAANRWNNFYGVSGAWRVTQDFKIPGVQELKLRAARGTAGIRPGFEYQYETFAVSSGQIFKNTLGNTKLKPAVQTENEVGLNATFLNRFDAEFVKSDRHTTGAFLLVPLSLAGSGGFTAQWQNAARIGGRTKEASLNARLFEEKNWGWTATLTADHSSQKIDELNRAPFRVGSTSQNQNIFFFKSGETMGVIYGVRWAHTLDELQDDPNNAGKDIASLYEVNSDGLVVAKGTRGLTTERPIKYVDKTGNSNVKIGDVNPDYSFGIANTIHFGGLTLYGLFDGTHGGNIYNFTKQWMFQDMRHGDLDQSQRAAADKHALEYYNVGFYNALEPNSYFIEDGSYVKLRELSLSYSVNPRVMNRLRVLGAGRSVKLALIGRNLKTWTNYTGFDPESASNGDFNFRIDGFRYPSLRQVTGQIEIGF